MGSEMCIRDSISGIPPIICQKNKVKIPVETHLSRLFLPMRALLRNFIEYGILSSQIGHINGLSGINLPLHFMQNLPGEY